jgi:hypothetical protein
MPGPEATDWVARIAQEIERLRRAWRPFARDLEQASKAIAAARDRGEWRRLSEAWWAFVVARDRGDFRDVQIRLRLMGGIVQQIEAAKGNPSHRKARAWLAVQHLTPKQIALLLPYMIMDLPELRIPRRRGKPKGRTAASTLEMAEELDRRIKRTGERPTTAARRLLAEHGVRAVDLKGRADHLVRAWKRRAFKSR